MSEGSIPETALVGLQHRISKVDSHIARNASYLSVRLPPFVLDGISHPSDIAFKSPESFPLHNVSLACLRDPSDECVRSEADGKRKSDRDQR